MAKKCYVGIDVGGTSAKIGLVDLDGAIIQKEAVQTLNSPDWQTIIDEMLIPVSKWVDEKDSDGHKLYSIKGIGIGTPGFVNKKTGILYNSENIPGLINAPFVPYIAEKFNVPVYADNDATCAAIAEHLFGAGKDFSDFLMVTVGTGIGGGLILDNKVYRGVNGFAGELGHIIVVAEGRECTCGNKGCIESYASATSIIKRIKEGIKKGYIKTYNDVDNINAKVIFEKAKEGDPYSIDAIDSAARYLGRMLGGLVNLLNVGAIIIGGGVSVEDYFIKKIEFYVNQVAWFMFTKDLKVIPAKLMNDAGIIGAASLVIDGEKNRVDTTV